MEQQMFTIRVRLRQSRAEQRRRRRELAAMMAALMIPSLLLGLVTALLIGSARWEGRETGAEWVMEAEPVPEAEDLLKPTRAESRYQAITESERELIARIVYLEARGEPEAGQQAVAEVILNRVAADNFPDSVEAVIDQEGQFSTAGRVEEAAPGDKQYEAVEAAMHGEPVLPMDVVYFSREGENENVWGKIGGHVFCYQYIWE